jgi:hypothetical protein
MSDIFVKTAGSGSTGWRKAANIFVKTAGLGSTGWKAAAGVWIKNATQWLKVWPLSGILATRVPFIATTSATAYADRLTTSSRVRIGTSYFGDNAQWDLNGWSATNYTYRWKLYDQFGSDLGIILRSGTGSGWTTTSGEDQLPASIWTTTNSTNADNQYLGFEVTANASSGSTYNGLSVSTKIPVIRQNPVNSTSSLSSYTPQSGVAITYSSTWLGGEAYKADSARTTIQWYTNSTSSTTGGTLVGSGSSYTPSATDSGKYIYAVETRYNSGTDYEFGTTTGVSVSAITTSAVAEESKQVTGSQRRTTLNSSFTSGTTVYVSTNGYISIGTDPASSISVPGSGHVLAILQADLVQTNLYHYATSTNFFVRWSGYRLGQPTKTVEYQAKFTWNSTNADVYFITNNLDSTDYNRNAVYNNGTVLRTWADSTATTIDLVAVGSMTNNTSKNNTDDGNTAITATATSTPPTGTAPTAGTATVTPETGTAGTTTYTGSASGTWTGTAPITYTYSWQYFSSSSYQYVQVATGSTYLPPSTFNTLYPNFGTRLVVRGTNSFGFAEATASFTISTPSNPPTPVTPTITVPTYSNVGNTTGTINWTSTNQSSFALDGSFSDSGTTATSVAKTGLNENTTYSGNITVTSSTGNTASRPYSFKTTTSGPAPTLYTVEFRSNGATGSPSVSSVTQTTEGGSVTLATIGTLGGGTNRIFGGWRTGASSGTVYAFGATFTPTSNTILYAYYGTQPTCVAPSFTAADNFRRVDSESQIIWFTDYPTPSGAYTEIIGMQFQIDTGSTGGGTRLADATRAYPGDSTYPYTGAGTIWAFKAGKDRSSVTTNRVDDVAYSANARYARVRVRMRGIDGVNYPGDWSTPWI